MKTKEYLNKKVEGYIELKDLTFTSRGLHVRNNRQYFLSCIINDCEYFRDDKRNKKNERIYKMQ